jgi:2-dehydropantoate 2-reductase
MRVCVFGAGAVGGYLAARLARAGSHEIAVVARGAHLRAIQSQGLRLICADEEFVVRPHAATDRAQDLPPQDVVIVTLKAHSQPAAAGDIASLLVQGGTAVFANNGIPWWWNYRGAQQPGTPLPLLDPDAELWKHVRPERAIGCVVYSANEVVQPGVVRHTANNLWLLGEPTGRRSDRLLAIESLLRDAQLDAQAVTGIRDRIWAKLLRNAPLNSLCALTRLSVDELAHEPQLHAMCNAVIDEIAAIAAADGCDLSAGLADAKSVLDLGGAIDGGTARNIRPSMLQDVLNGRPLEVEAILGQVQALAHASGTPCPLLDVLVPLVRGLDRSGRAG